MLNNGKSFVYTTVLVNMDLLDSLSPAGPSRNAEYIQTLAHELMHTQDLNKLGLFKGYNYTLTEGRHEQITNEAIGIANIYRGYDTQCKMKNGK